jgi:hypothetical protein
MALGFPAVLLCLRELADAQRETPGIQSKAKCDGCAGTRRFKLQNGSVRHKVGMAQWLDRAKRALGIAVS